MSTYDVVCARCKNFSRSSVGFKCKAFPKGIPEEILIGENDHAKPLKKQKNDIVFDPYMKTKKESKMGTTYEYYELRGLDPQGEMPSGLIRKVRSKEGLHFERITLGGEWEVDNGLIRYFAGYNDDAERVSKKEADKFIEYLQSGQAVIDKSRGEWK